MGFVKVGSRYFNLSLVERVVIHTTPVPDPTAIMLPNPGCTIVFVHGKQESLDPSETKSFLAGLERYAV